MIERIFGVMKKRFPILVKMEQFPYVAKYAHSAGQVEIVECAFLLHNFIRMNTIFEDEFYHEDDDEEVDVDVGRFEEDDVNDTWRNTIATQMWIDYNNHLRRTAPRNAA